MTTLTLTPRTAGTLTLTGTSPSALGLYPSVSLFPATTLYPGGSALVARAAQTLTLTAN